MGHLHITELKGADATLLEVGLLLALHTHGMARARGPVELQWHRAHAVGAVKRQCDGA